MNNIKLYSFLLGVAVLNSCAPTKNFSYDGKGFKDAYNSITSAELKENLYVIADDKMEGRDTGSAGQKKAGEYMIEQYKKNGIGFPAALGSYYQKVPSESMKKYGETLPDFCKRTGLNYSVMSGRIHAGCSFEEAVSFSLESYGCKHIKVAKQSGFVTSWFFSLDFKNYLWDFYLWDFRKTWT